MFFGQIHMDISTVLADNINKIPSCFPCPLMLQYVLCFSCGIISAAL